MATPNAVIEQPTKTYGMVTNGQYIMPKGIPRTRDKVAIVGFAPSSMQDVRVFFGDPAWEIWSINQLYIAFPAIVEHTTRWFQIHPRQEYDMAVRDIKHHQWMAQQDKFPIYMQEKEPDIPMAIPFPKDEMLAKFVRRYFTNSISWEIALAIAEGFSEIHVYGIDMSQDDEYAEQRPSVEYFVGWADALGIKFYIPAKSDLCKTVWLYPFEDDAPMRQKIDARRVELRNRVNETAANEQNLHDTRMQILGALDNMNYMQKTWSNAVRQGQPGQMIQKR